MPVSLGFAGDPNGMAHGVEELNRTLQRLIQLRQDLEPHATGFALPIVIALLLSFVLSLFVRARKSAGRRERLTTKQRASTLIALTGGLTLILLSGAVFRAAFNMDWGSAMVAGGTAGLAIATYLLFRQTGILAADTVAATAQADVHHRDTLSPLVYLESPSVAIASVTNAVRPRYTVSVTGTLQNVGSGPAPKCTIRVDVYGVSTSTKVIGPLPAPGSLAIGAQQCDLTIDAGRLDLAIEPLPPHAIVVEFTSVFRASIDGPNITGSSIQYLDSVANEYSLEIYRPGAQFELRQFTPEYSKLDRAIVERAVRAETGIMSGDLGRERLERIRSLDLSESHIASLALVGNLRGLQALTLARCESIVDIAPLHDLLQLRSLDLTGCARIVDLAPLHSLSALEGLKLSDCTGIQDIGPISRLPNLTTLELSGCTIPAIDALRAMRTLRKLDIGSCVHLIDLSPVDGLPVEELTLDGCTGFADISIVSSLGELWFLSLRSLRLLQAPELPDTVRAVVFDDCALLTDVTSLGAGRLRMVELSFRRCTSLTDLTPIGQLGRLAKLRLSGCTSVDDIRPLGNLTMLEELDLTDCAAITDLSPLLPTALSRLVLRNCSRVEDISVLAGIATLRDIDLRGCVGLTTIPEPLIARGDVAILGP